MSRSVEWANLNFLYLAEMALLLSCACGITSRVSLARTVDNKFTCTQLQ